MCLDRSGQADPPDHKGPPESKVHKAPKGLTVLKGLKDKKDNPAHRGSPDQRAHKDLKETQVRQALKDRLVTKDCKATQEHKA